MVQEEGYSRLLKQYTWWKGKVLGIMLDMNYHGMSKKPGELIILLEYINFYCKQKLWLDSSMG